MKAYIMDAFTMVKTSLPIYIYIYTILVFRTSFMPRMRMRALTPEMNLSLTGKLVSKAYSSCQLIVNVDEDKMGL